MTNRRNGLSNDLVKLANHLDNIGHNDLANRIDHIITKQAYGWDDFTSDVGGVATNVYENAAEGASDMWEGAKDIGSGAYEMVQSPLGAAVDVAQGVGNLGAAGLNALTGDFGDAGKDLGDAWSQVGDIWGEAKDFGGGVVDVAKGVGGGLWGAGQIAAAPVTGPLESAYDGATNWWGGKLDDIVQSRLPTDHVTHPELSDSQTQQDEATAAATGPAANLAPKAKRSWGEEYYPAASDDANVRAIQTALGVTPDGQFGEDTMGAWNQQMGNVAMPATSAEALAAVGSLANDHVTARYRRNGLRKSAGLTVQDKIDLLARQFTSGVPSNVRR
jgi:hypothetical protein